MALIDDVLYTVEDISKSVTDAISSGDFENLTKDVKNAIADFGVFEPGSKKSEPRVVKGYNGSYNKSYKKSNNFNRGKYQERNSVNYNSDYKNRNKSVYSNSDPNIYAGNNVRNRRTPFFVRTADRLSDWVKILLGGVFTFIFGLSGIFILAIGALHGAALPVLLGTVSLLIAGFSGFLLGNGISGKLLTDRYFLYGKLAGEKEYLSITEVARSTGKNKNNVLKDLKQMIKRGLLPQARFDRTESTLLLTKNAVSQYEAAENERIKREEEEKRRNTLSGAEKEVEDILREGNFYLKMIRESNDAIPDEEVSNKLYRLESIMNRIFDQVKRQPEKAKSIRRLMNYYLPTTEKLLKAYVDLDKQPEDLSTIKKTKSEISETLDLLNDAFEKLLDNMFSDMAWDISSDISVMRSMMEQDGLTEGKNTINLNN